MGLKHGKGNVKPIKLNLAGGALSRCWHLGFHDFGPEWDLEKFVGPPLQLPWRSDSQGWEQSGLLRGMSRLCVFERVHAYKENPS